jgi:hypothetical protein
MITVMNRRRRWAASVALGGCLAIGCGGASAPGTEQASQATPAQGESAGAAPAATPAMTNVADLFPAGPGREQVLNSCGSCHNAACSTIGQRTSARWDGLLEGHAGRVADADLQAAFSYLKANFNDTKPEPKVPPEFLQGGCTPPG